MAKATKVNDPSGSVAAASEFIEDSIAKFGKHHDTLKLHMTNQAEEIREVSAELEKLKVDSARELERTKETLTRERDEWKTKHNSLDEKVRRSAAALAS